MVNNTKLALPMNKLSNWLFRIVKQIQRRGSEESNKTVVKKIMHFSKSCYKTMHP